MSVPTYPFTVVGIRPAPGAVSLTTTTSGVSGRVAVARAIAAAAVVALQVLVVLGLTGVVADPAAPAAGPIPAPLASAMPAPRPGWVDLVSDPMVVAPRPGPAIPPP